MNFSKLNGYDVKDATARARVEDVNATLTQEQATIKARMDTFTTLPSGGGTAENAELLDIRVGHNGTTYGSAGEAVREQTRWAFQPDAFVTSGNYASVLPDANTANPMRAYLINGDITPEMIPNLPVYGDRYNLITFWGYGGASHSFQIAVTGTVNYIRSNKFGEWWTPWEPFTNSPYELMGGGFIIDGSSYTDANNLPENRMYTINNYITAENIANLPFYGERYLIVTLSSDCTAYVMGDMYKAQIAIGANGFAYRYKSDVAWSAWNYVGSKKTQISSQLTTITNRPYNFSGKTFKFFGDSIVDGCEVEKSYKQVFCEKVGASYTSYAVGGASFVVQEGRSSVIAQLQSTSLDCDYIFISAGINDHGMQVSDDSLKSALDATFTYIKNNFSGEVFVLTPINCNTSGDDELLTLRNMITEKALYYGFNVMNGGEYGFPAYLTNMEEILHWYTTESAIHPSQMGHNQIAKKLCYDLL